MDLWNEYEGRSIAGLFPLERLIRPEGRSAFFSTSSAGTATVIRLIESHFDEEEILARWTNVSDLHQPNLLTLTRFGQTTLDETSLVYVVLEPTEADLSQILCERPLTPVETRQVAASLIPALQALHESGFVHEHIQPANVLAVGEVVKLRSDCIREAPEGAEGAALRSRDVQGLATLLLQCLTQQRSHNVSPGERSLPQPFREIIENGFSGAWDLAHMASALDATTSQPATSTTRPTSSAAASVATQATPGDAAPSATVAHNPLPHRTVDLADVAANRHTLEPARDRIRVPVQQNSGVLNSRLVLVVIAFLGILTFTAYALSHRHAGKSAESAPPAAPAQSQTLTNQPLAGQSIAKTVPSAPIAPKKASISVSREEWRVVAFTYNRQSEANAKARDLERRFASLHPSVFAPTGHAPYLVTLGGPLSRDAAFRLKSKLHGKGLPRDVYAQNYSSKAL